jgi:hypothetical protein
MSFNRLFNHKPINLTVLSEIKNLGFRRQINQMGSAIQDHIGKKFGLVHLTGLGTGDSDPYGNLVFDQMRQIIIRAIPGGGFHGHVPAGIGPLDPVINEKDIHLVSLRMSDFAELETARCAPHIVLAQNK